MLDLRRYPLETLASRVGTPFYLYDGDVIRAAVGRFAAAACAKGTRGRYAMKANSTKPVLEIMRGQGLWIDAVSGNEVLRAMRAGFPGGNEPPAILLTSDVFRDNAVQVVLETGVIPSMGSPGMVEELREAGYRGPIAVRVNPGFGHGHADSCDTGGPSSKHGIWPDRLEEVRKEAGKSALPIRLLHAHIGTGPELQEFDTNAARLVAFFGELLPRFPDVDAVSLGGGIPHPYRPEETPYDFGSLRPVLASAVQTLSSAAGRPIRVEVEPGRALVAGGAALVTRVKDVKETRSNDRGPGHTFVMVDAGFCDLLRPAFYGAYHAIEVMGPRGSANPESCVVAGPLCESGDVFTRGEEELLAPRLMPRPEPGDLLALHDAGAYGSAMSSNYLSIGRAAEVWWERDRATLVTRRQTLEDVLTAEVDTPL